MRGGTGSHSTGATHRRHAEEIGTSVHPSPGTSVSGVYGGPGEDVQHHAEQGLGQGGEE